MSATDKGGTVARGDQIAPFALSAFSSGRPVSWRPGRVTVFSFCALWCVTWKEQAARLARAQQALEGLPIDYLTISVDGRWAEQYSREGSANSGMQSNRGAIGDRASVVLLDVGGSVSARLGVRAVPFTILADARGIVRYVHQGIVRADELTASLRQVATGREVGRAVGDNAAIYLTFDDFPSFNPSAPVQPSDDEALLDILRSAGVRATFFCIGVHLDAPSARAVAVRALREGHSLQIHSWIHDGSNPQMEKCRRAILALAPDLPSPRLYRPPGHSEIYRLDGTLAQPVRPTVNPYDFTRPGAAELTRRILQAARPGAVIQLHAGIEQTRDVLPGMIDSFRRQGFTFDTLDINSFFGSNVLPVYGSRIES